MWVRKGTILHRMYKVHNTCSRYILLCIVNVFVIRGVPISVHCVALENHEI